MKNTELKNLPQELKEVGRFCLVKPGEKIPYQCKPGAPQCARKNDPDTFSDYQTAVSYLKSNYGLYTHLGFLPTGALGFLDFDHCVDENGKIDQSVLEVIKTINSYTEFSRSGQGIHIYFKCENFINSYTKEDFSKKYRVRTKKAELYLSKLSPQYAILTGNHLSGTPNTLREVSSELRVFAETTMKRRSSENKSPASSDQMIIDSIRNSNNRKETEDFTALYDRGDSSSYPSRSEADFRLACLLAWRTGDNPGQIERIMRGSALARDGSSPTVDNKWNTNPLYLDLTIRNAIDSFNGAFCDPGYYTPAPVSPGKWSYLKKASEIEVKEVLWLWYPYLPRGAITILSASPGQGKTYLSTWIAACITSGKGFPINDEYNAKGNRRVIYLSWEDDYSRTLLPRFLANGGKPENLYYLEKERMPTSFADPVIKEIIKSEPDLVIFDALSSFVGEANINRFNDVRLALKPLLSLLENRNTAVLLIAHNNKMTSVTSAQDRVSGSVDFTALIRSGLSIGRDPDDEDKVVMAQFKNNLERTGESLSFSFLESSTGGLPSLNFEGPVDITADELLGAIRKKRPAVREAQEEMVRYLSEHSNRDEARKVKEYMHSQGFKDSTINRAKLEIGIVHNTQRMNNRNITFWSLPA